MTSIRSIKQSIANKLSDAADTAQDKAKALKSKATQQLHNLSGLASRKSTSSSGSAAPRQSLPSQLKQTMSEVKEDVKAFGQYIRHGNDESKAAMQALKPDLSKLKQDMKDFRDYLHDGDHESKAAMHALKQDLSKIKQDVKELAQFVLPAPGAPTSEARRAALNMLDITDKLPPGRVEQRMRTPKGRALLSAEVDRFEKKIGLRQQQMLRNDGDNIKPQLDKAVDTLLEGSREVKAQIRQLNAANVSEPTRTDSLQKLGLESDMSLAYIEANAKTPDGVARMKGELAAFEGALKNAYREGQMKHHPDKTTQRGEKSAEATARFDEFNKARTTLQDMAVGLNMRLAQLEKAVTKQ